jgi:hypothetical protein
MGMYQGLAFHKLSLLFKVFKIFNGGRGYARRRGDALGSGRREGREGRWGAPPRRETKGGLPSREGRGL